tara:strand:+ start:1023 stop:2423 length:1401 start_codon:yes stop_codon:yes gene_type:complete
MATVVKTFNYTGTLNQTTIPAGTTSIDVHLWGGAGGGGGSDAGGPGGTGAAGHYVTATSIDMTSHVGKTMTVAVGGGGAGGSSGGGASGGANGKSIAGYSGGQGGDAGPQPYSGSGGGGGGATAVLIDGAPIVVSGGGGSGAGAGKSSNGTAGINTNTATAESPGTLGENGKDHTGDGGGAGAGGGGTNGGTSGDAGSGDNGGTGGRAGSNTAAGGTENNGSGVTPGGTGVSYYSAGVAVGGQPSSSGGNGKAVVIFNVSVQANYKVAGEWKSINDVFYKVSGAWKRVTAGYFKVGGVWKALFNSGIEFTETAAGFGDAQGGSSSGGGGTGGGGGGGRVICTWLNLNDMFSDEDLKTDTEFSVKYLGRTLKIGYWFWAVPFVRYLYRAQKRKNTWDRFVIEATRMFAQARANEIAYKMGKRDRSDRTGKLARVFGEGLCWTVGVFVRPFVEKKFSQWLKVYDNKSS